MMATTHAPLVPGILQASITEAGASFSSACEKESEEAHAVVFRL